MCMYRRNDDTYTHLNLHTHTCTNTTNNIRTQTQSRKKMKLRCGQLPIQCEYYRFCTANVTTNCRSVQNKMCQTRHETLQASVLVTGDAVAIHRVPIHRSRVRVLIGHHCVVALGKLLTPVCHCHQAV